MLAKELKLVAVINGAVINGAVIVGAATRLKEAMKNIEEAAPNFKGAVPNIPNTVVGKRIRLSSDNQWHDR